MPCVFILLFFVYSLQPVFLSFFFYCSGSPLDLHSFPTRRSSDLRYSRRLFLLVLARRRSSGPESRDRSATGIQRSEEHTSELQSRFDLVCRLLLEKKKLKRLVYTII